MLVLCFMGLQTFTNYHVLQYAISAKWHLILLTRACKSRPLATRHRTSTHSIDLCTVQGPRPRTNPILRPIPTCQLLIDLPKNKSHVQICIVHVVIPMRTTRALQEGWSGPVPSGGHLRRPLGMTSFAASSPKTEPETDHHFWSRFIPLFLPHDIDGKALFYLT